MVFKKKVEWAVEIKDPKWLAYANICFQSLQFSGIKSFDGFMSYGF